MLADGAGAGKGVEIGPGFQEKHRKVCSAIESKGKEGIDGHNVNACAFTVIGLGRRWRYKGEALALGKSDVGNYICKPCFL